MIAALTALVAVEPPPGWTAWLPGILAAAIMAAAAILGTLGTVYVKRMGRGVDDATIEKTYAETKKLRIDSDGREVEIARGLLDDIRKELDRYRTEMERDRERHAAEMERDRAQHTRQVVELTETNDKRYADVAAQLDKVQAAQAELRDRIDEHAPWDIAAHELLRRHDADFPDPPPLNEHR